MKNIVCMIIKPDAVSRGLSKEILADIKSRGWEIVCQEKKKIDAAEATRFYQEHAQKPFFRDLVDYMTSGHSIVMAVRVPSVEDARAGVGATDPLEAEKGTIRQQFGVEKSRNSIHCSDSDDSAKYELGIFFVIHKHLRLYMKEIPEAEGMFEYRVQEGKDIPKLITTGDADMFKYACEGFLSHTLCESYEVIDPSLASKDQ